MTYEQICNMIDEVKSKEDFEELLNRFQMVADPLFEKVWEKDAGSIGLKRSFKSGMRVVINSKYFLREKIHIVCVFTDARLEEYMELWPFIHDKLVKFSMRYACDKAGKIPYIKVDILPYVEAFAKEDRNMQILEYLSDDDNVDNLINQAVENEIRSFLDTANGPNEENYQREIKEDDPNGKDTL